MNKGPRLGYYLSLSLSLSRPLFLSLSLSLCRTLALFSLFTSFSLFFIYLLSLLFPSTPTQNFRPSHRYRPSLSPSTFIPFWHRTLQRTAELGAGGCFATRGMNQPERTILYPALGQPSTKWRHTANDARRYWKPD